MKSLLIITVMFLAIAQCDVPHTVKPWAANDASQEAADRGDGQKETVFWKGEISGKQVVWSNEDFTISNFGSGDFSWRQNAERDFEKLELDADHCSYIRDFQVLSIVGTFVSVQDLESIICGTHSDFLHLETYDLSKADVTEAKDFITRPAKITLKDIFSKEVLFEGLLENEEMKSFLKRTAQKPLDLNSLLRIIENEYNLRVAGDYALSSDLDSFAFYKYTNDKQIVVRLFLEPTSGYNAGSSKFLDIILPITDDLLRRYPFFATDQNDSEFFLSEQDKILLSRKTEFRK